MDILWGIAKGLTYGELAHRLQISNQTVPVHIKNISTANWSQQPLGGGLRGFSTKASSVCDLAVDRSQPGWLSIRSPLADRVFHLGPPGPKASISSSIAACCLSPANGTGVTLRLRSTPETSSGAPHALSGNSAFRHARDRPSSLPRRQTGICDWR